MTTQSGERQKAFRDSWKSVPMPKEKRKLAFRRIFTKEEVELISLGLIPGEMEDKWFVFAEDQEIFFHRSWTGHCIYSLQLELIGDNYSVFTAWLNQNGEQYRNDLTDEEYEIALLSFLIDNLLLGKESPFPLPNGLPKSIPGRLYQHHVAGSGYPEKKLTSSRSLFGWLNYFFTKVTRL